MTVVGVAACRKQPDPGFSKPNSAVKGLGISPRMPSRIRAANRHARIDVTRETALKKPLMQIAADNLRRRKGWPGDRTEAEQAADFRAELKRVTKIRRAAHQRAKQRKKQRDAKYRVTVIAGGAIETNHRKH